jgi:two-component system, OmpR family, response regulator
MHIQCESGGVFSRRKCVSLGVLLVEDSPSSQLAFTELLQVLGFRLLGILAKESDATEWLHAHRAQADVVVLDLLLLEGSGFNLIARAREQQPRAKVLVFSDFATPAIAEKCRSYGADAVFRKSEGREFTAYLEALAGGAKREPGA